MIIFDRRTASYAPIPDVQENLTKYTHEITTAMEGGLTTARKEMLLAREKTLYRARTTETSSLTEQEMHELIDLVKEYKRDEKGGLKDAFNMITNGFTLDETTRNTLLTNMDAIERSLGLVKPNYTQTTDNNANMASYQEEANELMALIKTSKEIPSLEVIAQSAWIMNRTLYRAGNSEKGESCLTEDHMDFFIQTEEWYGTAKQVEELKQVQADMKNGFTFNQEKARKLNSEMFKINMEIGLDIEMDKFQRFNMNESTSKQPLKTWLDPKTDDTNFHTYTQKEVSKEETSPNKAENNPFAIRIELPEHNFR